MGEKALATNTYSDYLAIEAEAEAEVKYEYHDGLITAMASGTPEHGQIAGNFIWATNNDLRDSGKNCIIYNSDVKVHIAGTRRTFYPDASVVCEKPLTSKKDPNAITNPLLILEVLSASTAEFDRGAKFAHYRNLPSLREYVLISPTEAMVDTYYRTEDGTWEITTLTSLKDMVLLKSIACEIKMADIYRLVPEIDPKSPG